MGLCKGGLLDWLDWSDWSVIQLLCHIVHICVFVYVKSVMLTSGLSVSVSSESVRSQMCH